MKRRRRPPAHDGIATSRRKRARRTAIGTNWARNGRTTNEKIGERGRNEKPDIARAERMASRSPLRRATRAREYGVPSNRKSPPAPTRMRSAPARFATLRVSRIVGAPGHVKGVASTPPRASAKFATASSGRTRMASQPRWASRARRCGRSSPSPSKSSATANALRFAPDLAHLAARASSADESTPPPVSTATRLTSSRPRSTAASSSHRSACAGDSLLEGTRGEILGPGARTRGRARTPRHTVAPETSGDRPAMHDATTSRSRMSVARTRSASRAERSPVRSKSKTPGVF